MFPVIDIADILTGCVYFTQADSEIFPILGTKR